MTVFSRRRKSEDHRNSSISVRGLGGAELARIGISFGNSNSSSSLNWFCLAFKMLLSLKESMRNEMRIPIRVNLFFGAIRIHVVVGIGVIIVSVLHVHFY
jgi:hypothetical protein